MTSPELDLDALEQVATDATLCTGFAQDVVTGEEVAELLAKNPGPCWFAWTGTTEDSLFVAITGNGPCSEANAKLVAWAKPAMLALLARCRAAEAERDVQRMRAEGFKESCVQLTLDRAVVEREREIAKRERDALRTENAALRAVVEWYATVPRDDDGATMPLDMGERARAALAALPEVTRD